MLINRHPPIVLAIIVSFALMATLGLMAAPRVAAAQAITYVEGFDALPVMGGMAQTDESLIFDTPAGRILQAHLVGDVAYNASVDFYRATLRSLGWTQNSASNNELIFTREDETLRVEWRATITGDLGITFELNPAPTR